MLKRISVPCFVRKSVIQGEFSKQNYGHLSASQIQRSQKCPYFITFSCLHANRINNPISIKPHQILAHRCRQARRRTRTRSPTLTPSKEDISTRLVSRTGSRAVAPFSSHRPQLHRSHGPSQRNHVSSLPPAQVCKWCCAHKIL